MNNNNQITGIQCVTSQGVGQSHVVGYNGLASIKIEPLYFTGDPFDHYVGRNDKGEILFTIHPSCPTQIIYEKYNEL